MSAQQITTGSPLPQWVQNQIKRRQQIIGNNPEALSDSTDAAEFNAYKIINTNNKNAWSRLASSVNITNSEGGISRLVDIDGVGTEFGSTIAQNYTLFGGVNFNPLTNKGGIWPENLPGSSNFALPYSYGIGDKSQGLQPIPGLESVNIRQLGRYLRKVEIRIKAHNKTQFSIIDALYLRLGYYMLLEWGHTNYINNEGEFVKIPSINKPYENFIEGEKKDYEIEQLIINQRKQEGGNYDGTLFLVTNFNWSIESNGSYNISIQGTSKGGLIESIVLSKPGFSDSKNRYTLPIINPEPTDGIIKSVLDRYKTKIETGETEFAAYKREIATQYDAGNIEELIGLGAVKKEGNGGNLDISNSFEGEADDNVDTILYQNASYIHEQLFNFYRDLKRTKLITSEESKLKYKKLTNEETGETTAIQIAFNQKNSSNEHGAYEYNYITFETLLGIIKDYLGGNEQKSDQPQISIYNGKSPMFTHWYQHSVNPKVCIVPFTYVDEGEENKVLFDILGEKFREPNSSPFSTSKSKFQGDIMNIYLNIENLVDALNNTKSDEGEINLYDFLYKITGQINSVMGGINNFEIVVNPSPRNDIEDDKGVTERLEIRDDTVIPTDDEQSPTNEVELKLFGTIPNVEGSFVRNISTTSQVTPKLLTIITIGSVASNVDQSTALMSRWNSGTTDRLREKMLADTKQESEDNKLLKILEKNSTEHLNFIKETYVDFISPSDDRITTAKKSLRSLLEYDLAIKTINGDIAGKGFIPINLTAEMDGLSGILPFCRIKPSNEILPNSYVNNINFVIQNIDHSIQGNEWLTTINTLSTPQKKDLTKTNRKTISSKNGFSFIPIDAGNTGELLEFLNNV